MCSINNWNTPMDLTSIYGERKGYLYENISVNVNSSAPCQTLAVTAYVRGVDLPVVDRNTSLNKLFVEHVWPAAIVLSDYLCKHVSVVQDKVVFEFGAGAALPSIVAEKLGSSLVLATDYPDQLVLSNIADLIRVNHCSNAYAIGHTWGEDIDGIRNLLTSLDKPSNTKADVILLADVLWKDTYQFHRSLLKSVTDCLKSDGIVLLAVAHRPCDQHSPSDDLELLELAEKDFGLQHRLVYSSEKYCDAMEMDLIEVFVFELRFKAILEESINLINEH